MCDQVCLGHRAGQLCDSSQNLVADSTVHSGDEFITPPHVELRDAGRFEGVVDSRRRLSNVLNHAHKEEPTDLTSPPPVILQRRSMRNSMRVRKTDAPDPLLCPLCKTHFVEPKVLCCGHTFCNRCLERKDDHFCPICKKKNTTCVDNFVVRDLVHKWRRESCRKVKVQLPFTSPPNVCPSTPNGCNRDVNMASPSLTTPNGGRMLLMEDCSERGVDVGHEDGTEEQSITRKPFVRFAASRKSEIPGSRKEFGRGSFLRRSLQVFSRASTRTKNGKIVKPKDAEEEVAKIAKSVEKTLVVTAPVTQTQAQPTKEETKKSRFSLFRKSKRTKDSKESAEQLQ